MAVFMVARLDKASGGERGGERETSTRREFRRADEPKYVGNASER